MPVSNEIAGPELQENLTQIHESAFQQEHRVIPGQESLSENSGNQPARTQCGQCRDVLEKQPSS